MFFTIGILLLIPLIWLIYILGQKEKKWFQLSTVIFTVLFTAIIFGNIGVELGSKIEKIDFYTGARRNIGHGLSFTANQIKDGKKEEALSKIIYMDQMWYQIKFFDEDEGESMIDFVNKLSSDNIKVQQADGL